MELILKQDVQNVGFKDDIVTVKAGYGRNYLIPQGFATLATPSAKKVLAENLKQKAHKEAKVVADANTLAETLKAIDIKIFAKAGGEKLFGSITSIDIADFLAKNGHKCFVLSQGGDLVEKLDKNVIHLQNSKIGSKNPFFIL